VLTYPTVGKIGSITYKGYDAQEKVCIGNSCISSLPLFAVSEWSVTQRDTGVSGFLAMAAGINSYVSDNLLIRLLKTSGLVTASVFSICWDMANG